MTIFFRSEKLIRYGEGCPENKKASQMRSFSVSFSKQDYFFLLSMCFEYLFMNLSTRPAVSTNFIFPV